MSLPEDFLWGTATAAAQIEGAAHEDGKEDSIWDAFARVPGAVVGGDTPEVADDHYHRMPGDVALMRELGIRSYRFSTSWARVKPGDREPNPAGLDFYSRLVDQLLEADILPWLTLYHWDMPQAVQTASDRNAGGWANRDTAYRFRDYALMVHEALGDRVTHWTTFNEPFCSALLGYAAGIHAPGLQDPAAALAAVHHQHLGHGLAVQALRERGAQQVGITLNLTNAIPADPDDPVDLDAARRIDGMFNRIFLEPLLLGRYPQDVVDDVGVHGLTIPVEDGDLEVIHQPLDFLGVNYYHDDQVSGHGAASGTSATEGSPFVGSEFVTFPPRDLPHTAMGWEVNAAGLSHLLTRLGREYADLPPLYVTENGAAYDDQLEAGHVHDAERVDYLEQHIRAVEDAVDAGADVRGYFVWSLMDNFEWALGYSKRFGIVFVDYATQERIVKDSGAWYARRIAAVPVVD